MSIQKTRLIQLLQFAQQSAQLRSRAVASTAQHGLFQLQEQQIQGLPGVRVNLSFADTGEEIWLAVERLHEVPPPMVEDPLLEPWLDMTGRLLEQPKLFEVINGADLIKAGTHSPTAANDKGGKPGIDPSAPVILAEFDREQSVRAHLATYIEVKWRAWARVERQRRETIQLYSKLFTLKQQLEGGIVEAQIELVFGAGVGVWSCKATTISYPLLSQLVELSLNPETAALEVRPRDVEVRLELDWYAANDNHGVASVERAAKDYWAAATTTFSPFDRGTFEALLRTAAANLDSNGSYWPDQTPVEDRSLPRADDKLKVTDTWVLFARPRTNGIILQDLQRLAAQVEMASALPPAVAAIVSDPETSNPIVELPSYRGVSSSYGSEGSTSQSKPRDLYFPKPFNHEQVRIVQLLEISDGVVVQGPPGTGKTHTIANVICHYLAEGKRVLVTSMKEPALAVLQEQLPAEIRPLAISLLASEQDGMKQFEHSIQKIASEVQGLDRSATSREISYLEESIDALHSKLALIDRRIATWARVNLEAISLDGIDIEPDNAAREVVAGGSQFEWIPDVLGIGPAYAPQFTDADVMRLREARRHLGRDIDYLETLVPEVIEFPTTSRLLEIHQELAQFAILKEQLDRGDIPCIVNLSQETLSLAEEALTSIAILRDFRAEADATDAAWITEMRDRVRRGDEDGALGVLEALGSEIDQAVEHRKKFYERPIVTPPGMELDEKLVGSVHKLGASKSPFGLSGIFGKAEEKKALQTICILGRPARGADDWIWVGEWLEYLKSVRALTVRWNVLSTALPIETVSEDDSLTSLPLAAEYLVLVRGIRASVGIEEKIRAATARLFSDWPNIREMAKSAASTSDLERALRHNLARTRLAHAGANRERLQEMLIGKSGRVVETLRRFVEASLGNPALTDAEVRTKWSELMLELSRVRDLKTSLQIVQEVCDKVHDSGAPLYSEALKQAATRTVDDLLPDNWRQAWKLRRLATHLVSIDGQDDLRNLAQQRAEVEADLSSAYRLIVGKRTWLNLAQNASPSIRAALQAYLNAIMKIGRGQGKRAVRYRQDARAAASAANPAVPCWIMAHYRVSESLPAELGCFDLVVIDEASQSDLAALPALLRAKKILIVGDDKQVSPEGVGLEEEKVRTLMSRFLESQVETFRPQMSPERSIYDLFKVVFATSAVMLKEHFRCVSPIIEYSKREFYNHELKPLRLPKKSERLDPPLIDVLVEDGFRNGDVNMPEALFIVKEIKAIVSDPLLAGRSIGVVSLLADKQALKIWEMLSRELGPELIERHRITCGDARTFQGKERDIMFLSMVSAPNEIGAPMSRDTFAQRFNVAASRARDRMYLVRSVEPGQLSDADRMRRSLIAHFAAPYAQDEARVEDLRGLCESAFEREMYDELAQRGFMVTPQVVVGQYRIDMVIEGHNDARLAVECDGDSYHGPDKWADDMERQRVLERAGWTFWRCFASAFRRRRSELMNDLVRTLSEAGIEPIGAEGAQKSVHTERRVVSSLSGVGGEACSSDEAEPHVEPGEASSSEVASTTLCNALLKSSKQHGASESSVPLGELRSDAIGMEVGASHRKVIGRLVLAPYTEYSGRPGPDPRSNGLHVVSEGLVRVIEVEGPVVAKRAYDIYLRGCGIKRMGHELKSTMNKALSQAVRQGVVAREDEEGWAGCYSRWLE